MVLFQVKQGDVGLPVDRIYHIVDEERGTWVDAQPNETEYAGGRTFLYEQKRYPLLQVGALLQKEILKT